MGLRAGPALETEALDGCRGRLGERWIDAVSGSEDGACHVDRRRVIDVAGHGHDGIGRAIRLRPERADLVTGQRANAVLVASYLPAERRVAKKCLVEDVEDVLRRVVAIGADLFDDDLAFAAYVLRPEQRPNDQVTE